MSAKPLRIDFVSDIACPWCAVGLSALEQADLISSRKAARHVFYAINTKGLGGVVSYLLNDCCGSNPEISACCRHPARNDRQCDGITAER